MKQKAYTLFPLTVIILIGAFFRFLNLNWDINFHLHPDERFLTMVGNSIQISNSFFDYLSPDISKLNPYNVNYDFFVYGIFPLVLNKILAVIFNNDTYNNFTLQGRGLSALIDLLSVIVLFKIVLVFEKKLKLHHLTKYFASLFYAVSVLPIQLSHFFAVDTFLVFFMLLSFYFSLRFWESKKILFAIASGLSVALAIACKLNGIFIIPLNISFLFLACSDWKHLHLQKELCHILRLLLKKINLQFFLLTVTVFFSSMYIGLRLFYPYLFNDSSFLNLSINTQFLQNLETLRQLSHPFTTFPPSFQWVGKTPIFFSLYNLAFFGIGIALFSLVLIGVFLTFKEYKKGPFIIMLLWVAVIFIFQSSQFAQNMRYFLPLYPFFAFIAALTAVKIWQTLHYKGVISLLVLVFIWPFMFISIYFQPHTRIAASKWMYENAPSGSTVLVEHWDDGLPLSIENTKVFNLQELPVFNADTDEKWSTINNLIDESDYLILSSGRGYESIYNVKERYPIMTRFYQDLFAGKKSYTLVASFTSYPSFNYINIPIFFPDDTSEEGFRVHDHPKVLIYKKL